MNELFVRAQLFSFVTFGDGGGIVTFSIIRHAERELRFEMVGLDLEDVLQPGNGAVVIASAESEHRIVVLFLERRHNVFDKGNVVQEHERAQVPLSDAAAA